jgi:hypothetical protein
MNRIWQLINAPVPKRFVYLSIVVLATLLIGFRLGSSLESEKWSKVISMQRIMFNHREHPRYTNPIPAMAAIVLERVTNGYRASVEVEMTYPEHGVGSRGWFLGVASTQSEAIERWGLVDWKEAGIYAGKASNQLIVKRDELEGGGR